MSNLKGISSIVNMSPIKPRQFKTQVSLLWRQLLCILVALVATATGHGRLVDPPSRASAWRYGFNTPVNYDDNQLYCGGKQVQWEINGGRCGVCGDPYQGPRDHEAGGRYATGTIVRTYQEGDVIEAKVELTANHIGWFEFRLCATNNPRVRATQQCLDRGLLHLAGVGQGQGTRLHVDSSWTHVSTKLQLPSGLTCNQCVLQWKYNAGNSWGVDERTGQDCVGCGPQEQFYACADIAIVPGNHGNTRNTHGSRKDSNTVPSDEHVNNAVSSSTETSLPNTNRLGKVNTQIVDNQKQTDRVGGSPSIAYPRNFGSATAQHQGRHASFSYMDRQSYIGSNRYCRASEAWAGNSGLENWCRRLCSTGHCAPMYCTCY